MYLKPTKLAALVLTCSVQCTAAFSNTHEFKDNSLHSELQQTAELNQDFSKPEVLKRTVEQAITQFSASNRTNWSYTLSKYEDEEGDITSSIEQHNALAAKGQRWALLQIDGDKPSTREQERYQKKKAKKDKQKQEQSYSFRLAEIIKMETLQLVSISSDRLKMSFEVNLSQFGEEASSKLQGILHYDLIDKYIEGIEISNTDSFSPMFSADITKLLLEMHFIKIQDSVLPAKNRMVLQGTWAFFTEINEVSEATYSNYEVPEELAKNITRGVEGTEVATPGHN
ncbi:hypothetical protein [Planctobacterium marinum]|uniref:Uncharacterized protein n=1 Tax=Planctobacterium marinum TaxID=1631968 RepID=A0AA48HJI9_9ALTE|nr:hypothetical protein MACH26_14120 [Planctobacterium marinum]